MYLSKALKRRDGFVSQSSRSLVDQTVDFLLVFVSFCCVCLQLRCAARPAPRVRARGARMDYSEKVHLVATSLRAANGRLDTGQSMRRQLLDHEPGS